MSDKPPMSEKLEMAYWIYRKRYNICFVDKFNQNEQTRLTIQEYGVKPYDYDGPSQQNALLKLGHFPVTVFKMTPKPSITRDGLSGKILPDTLLQGLRFPKVLSL